MFLHIVTIDYGHNMFSNYSFFELFILTLTVVTGLKTKLSKLIFLITFLFEAFWFYKNERPISPDIFIMLITGFTRIYILYWVLKKQIIVNRKI